MAWNSPFAQRFSKLITGSNPENKDGGPKSKWYQQALGFTRENAHELARQIIFDPAKAVPTFKTDFGQKYSQIIPIRGANGRMIDVTVIWMRYPDGVVRLVTAPPPKNK